MLAHLKISTSSQKCNGLPSTRINDIVGILAWRDADTLDDIKKIYRQTKKANKR